MIYNHKCSLVVLFMVVFGGVGFSASNCCAQCPPAYIFTGEGAFGHSVSGAGDVNNDGFADVIVGSYRNNAGGILAGRAYIYSGQTGGLLHTFTGEAANDQFGWSVSGAGDINNDGFADVIVGSLSGRAYIYSGQTGGLLYTFFGQVANNLFGYSVSEAGDINNDGFADVIVGEFFNNAGRAYIYSGQTGGILYTFTGEAADNKFGVSVSGAGDINNDGFADVIVGAIGNDAGGDNAGRAYIYSGQTGELLHTFTGEAAGDVFGSKVSGAGDVNNDGFADVIVGTWANSAGGAAAGRAYIYSGQTGGLLYTFTGEAAGDQFGQSVSEAGDINNDGFADVIVGARLNQAGVADAGRAYIYSGQTGGLLYAFTAGVLGENFGYSVSEAGDVNNDGFADVIVGGTKARAYIYSFADSDACAGCCDTAGDFNNDGSFNIADVTSGIARIFGGGPAPFCQDEGDANGDNAFNIADVTYGIARIFSGGSAPACGTTGG